MINSCRIGIRACVVASLLLASATAGHAQDATAPPARANAVYVELLGNGGAYSVNYERALTPALRVRVGAASWTAESFWSDAETRFATFPMMLHVVPGGGAHHFEAGIGVLPGQRAAPGPPRIKWVRLTDSPDWLSVRAPRAAGRGPRGIHAVLRLWRFVDCVSGRRIYAVPGCQLRCTVLTSFRRGV